MSPTIALAKMTGLPDDIALKPVTGLPDEAVHHDLDDPPPRAA